MKKLLMPFIATAFCCCSGSVNASMVHIPFPTDLVVSMQKAHKQFLSLYAVNYESTPDNAQELNLLGFKITHYQAKRTRVMQ